MDEDLRIPETEALEGIVSGFDPEEYRRQKSDLEAQYAANGGRQSAQRYREAQKKIDVRVRENQARQTFPQWETMQRLYVAGMRLLGIGATRILEKGEEALEKDLHADYVMLEIVQENRFSEMVSYENGVNQLRGLFQQENDLMHLIEGYTREMDELDYLMETMRTREDIDPTQLSVIDPEMAQREYTQVARYKTQIMRKRDQTQMALSKVYLNQKTAGKALQESERKQELYETQMNTLMGGIVQTIDQIGANPVLDLGTLIEISNRFDTKESVVNRLNSNRNVLYQNPDDLGTIIEGVGQGPAFKQYPETEAGRTYIDDATQRSHTSANVQMDKLRTNSEQLRNKYGA